MKMINCNYCGKESNLVTGKEIYPHRGDLSSLYFYQCKPCGAYVGTHAGTTEPLGKLADKETRKWRLKAHKAFDKLWKSGDMKRGEAYGLLAKALDVNKSKCHIGLFDINTCKRVVDFSNTSLLEANK